MIDKERIFDALADEQRRQMLVGLLEEEQFSIPPLSHVSEEITTAHEALLRQYLSGSLEIAGTDKALVRIHQDHLPQLAEYGFVEWERDAHLVTQGPRFHEVQPLLEVMIDQQEDDPAPPAVVPLRG